MPTETPAIRRAKSETPHGSGCCWGFVVMVVVGFEFDGWDVADLAVESDLVEPPNQFKVASSRSSTPRQGPSCRTYSVL